MIGQDADRNRFKGAARLNGKVGLPQAIYFFDQQAARTVRENNGEKEKATLDICAAIIRHPPLYHA